MAIDVASAVEELMSRNLGPDPMNPAARQRPNYGVAAALDGGVLAMVLTFRSGSAFCCMEWGCHLTLDDDKRWHGLREALARHGASVPEQLELRLDCVVEEGAVFFDPVKPDPDRRGWYAFRAVAAQRYRVSATESAEDP